ncbi:MAG: hypothetical protein DRJ55_03025 [Thermoprotei archaeon]|nr:MAG: hypothetical protein DRJ55_03025 [Thermoprotei archaeon]
MQILDLSLISGSLTLLVVFIVLYRLVVAGVFIFLARRIRGELSLTRSEIIWITVASLIDTVLGLFALAIIAFTRRIDVDAAKRIISRTSRDVDDAIDALSGSGDVRIENIVRDLRLVKSKLKELEEEKLIGAAQSIDMLESVQSAMFTIRDKADDIALEQNPQRRDHLIRLVEKKMEYVKSTLEKLLSFVT